MKKDIGALWKRTGKYGNYLSGQIEIGGTKHHVRIYENSYKSKDKDPDYKIFPNEKLTGSQITTKTLEDQMSEDDIPF